MLKKVKAFHLLSLFTQMSVNDRNCEDTLNLLCCCLEQFLYAVYFIPWFLMTKS